MKPVNIIGIGLSPDDMTVKHLRIIEGADILVGGRRHLEYFENHPGEKKVIDRDIKGVVRFIRDHMEKAFIVVLASGDPLFFGIGPRLVHALGPENVVVHPNISTVSAAFSRLKEPWQEVRVISLHGRSGEKALLDALAAPGALAVYTDPKKNPAWLGRLLMDNGMNDVAMCVLEQLGTPAESVEWRTPEQAANETFSEPNLVVLKPSDSSTGAARRLHLGMPDDAFEHNKGLITKSEVRAVTLAKLRLSPGCTLWDLGAGSGSVAIEASIYITRGRIIAVEQHADRIAQIEKNKRRFNVRNLTVMHATLPDGLDDLPRPDRVFIGGGGKRLEKIIKAACERLKPDGVIVINTVLVQNLHIALETLKQLGFDADFVQIQTARSRSMPWGERLQAENPVWIVQGSLIQPPGIINSGGFD